MSGTATLVSTLYRVLCFFDAVYIRLRIALFSFTRQSRVLFVPTPHAFVSIANGSLFRFVTGFRFVIILCVFRACFQYNYTTFVHIVSILCLFKKNVCVVRFSLIIMRTHHTGRNAGTPSCWPSISLYQP